MFFERIAVAAIVALSTIECAQAGSSRLHSWCVPRVEVGKEKIECHVRSDDGVEIVEANAVVVGGRQLKGSLEKYGSAKRTSAWYFLIQQSGMLPAHLEKMSKAVASLATFDGRQCVVVATYSGSLLQRTVCGAFKHWVDSALHDIRLASTANEPAALYKAARDAILRLDAIQADRKALVILSNGDNADHTVTEANVVDLAGDRNIVIYGLVFGDESVGRPQNLFRLAEKTFGVSRDFSDQSSNDVSSFASNFTELLENGFVLRLDARDLPRDSKLVISARLRANTVLAAAPVVVHRTTEGSFLNWFRRLIQENFDNFTMSVAAAALLLGLLLIGSSQRGRWRTAADRAGASPGPVDLKFDEPAATPDSYKAAETGPRAISDADEEATPDTIYGWLQFLDASSTQVPVTSTSLRIGRHPDNDICLPNKSVHRQHAVLHKTSDGAFVIRDLGTKNGVVVNGNRCNQHSLADNDLIELGEVRLRFLSNKEPARLVS